MNELPPEITENVDRQQDHLDRMKENADANKEYYDKIMAIRYPIYIGLIKKYSDGGKLLDIGSGFGDKWFEGYVRPSGFVYYCTDIADEIVAHMSDLLSVQGSETYAKKGVLEYLPWDTGTFDVVYASHILEHTTDIKAAFSEIRRILKPEGILLFAVPCGYDEEPAHTYNREFEEWQEDFRENGWQVVDSGRFDFNDNEFYGVAKPDDRVVRQDTRPAGGSIIRRLKGLFRNQPTLADITSQLCTASQFQESIYGYWLSEMGQNFTYHRKPWEYVFILQALKKFDLLKSGVRGLGFGCGKEPLAAAMAKHGCEIMATDIEPFDDSDDYWGARTAADLYFPGVCSEELFNERVSFSYADMNQFPDSLYDDYDFVWSCCALEHLGSLAAGMDFILNSTVCLRPGGVAVHTTEINLTDGEDTMETPGLSLYRKKDIKALEKRLQENGCSMLPCNWYSGDLPEDKHIDLPPYKQQTHLKLMIERYVVTSLGLVIIKD